MNREKLEDLTGHFFAYGAALMVWAIIYVASMQNPSLLLFIFFSMFAAIGANAKRKGKEMRSKSDLEFLKIWFLFPLILPVAIGILVKRLIEGKI